MDSTRKIDLLYGFLLGLLVALAGAALFILAFTHYGVAEGFSILHEQGKLGKVLALGAILDVFLFFFLLRKKREVMARGIIMTFFFLAIAGLFL